MQLQALWAYEVEEKDFLAIDGECVGYVHEKNDHGDGILFTVKDEDGDATQYPFGPFDSVTIVESFEEDGSVPEEWEFFYEEGGPFDQ